MVSGADLSRGEEAVVQAGGRVASVHEMADWLIGHLHSGLGNQHYDFPTIPDRAFMITKDMDLPTLHGHAAMTIIVPPGVTVRYDDLGDSKLLFAEDFSKADKWNGPLAIAPKVLEELSKRDYWAEAFIFAEPDEEANRKAGKTAAARNAQKNDKAKQHQQGRGGFMKGLLKTFNFGSARPEESKAPVAAVSVPSAPKQKAPAV